jgi:hypothetical protein
MKIIGKLYSGKPNVQFDEGELEIEPLATTPALYSTVTIVKALLVWINSALYSLFPEILFPSGVVSGCFGLRLF